MIFLKMKMLKAFGFLMSLSLLLTTLAFAQSNNENISLSVTADKSDWIYSIGETPQFKITVTENGKPLKDVKVKYELGLEKLTPTQTETITLKKGEAIVKGYSLKEPGFLRLSVSASINNKEIKNLTTVAFEPFKIQPTVTMPADFNQYWDNAKKELAKLPIDAKLELLKEHSTDKVDVYHVNLQNIGASRVYGILSVPKKEGKYPAILRVPGAGVRNYTGDIHTASKGFITLVIGIHGVPVNLNKEVYESLRIGALSGYNAFNLDNKNSFYYKRVYMGCIRAIDYLTSHPFFDGTNLGVQGGSQGGALAITTASLDKRVKFMAAYYPALSDVTGYLHGRAGGWPHYFTGRNAALNNTKEKLETIQYYDVVNFARQLTTPAVYSWGYNDVTCPPTSMYAAYNVIKAPKELYIYKETGHNTIKEQKDRVENWLTQQLKK